MGQYGGWMEGREGELLVVMDLWMNGWMDGLTVDGCVWGGG